MWPTATHWPHDLVCQTVSLVLIYYIRSLDSQCEKCTQIQDGKTLIIIWFCKIRWLVNFESHWMKTLPRCATTSTHPNVPVLLLTECDIWLGQWIGTWYYQSFDVQPEKPSTSTLISTITTNHLIHLQEGKCHNIFKTTSNLCLFGCFFALQTALKTFVGIFLLFCTCVRFSKQAKDFVIKERWGAILVGVYPIKECFLCN